MPAPRLPLRRRRRAKNAAAWTAYLARTEPALAALPRVHRFAAVPVIGEAATPVAPITVHQMPAGGRLEGHLRAALAETRAEHVLLSRAGDTIAPLALERLGQAATLAPDADVITCDSDRLEVRGARSDPRFRPGPSPDRWLAVEDSGPALLVRREAALRALGSAPGGALHPHVLALALAGPGGERHAHVPVILVHENPAAPSAPDSASPALGESLAALLRARDPGARLETACGPARGAGGMPTHRRVRREIPGEPLVEAIVCLRDRSELLTRCADSLLHRTAYDHLQLTIVDNGSIEPATAAAIGRLSRDPRVRVVRDGRPFNFAALNNLAVRDSRADVVVFLNNDTEVVQDGWLEPLLEEALRPEVGAVAPLLLYPDGTVQHAGAALGLHGYAGHPFAGLAPDTPTPFGRAAQGTRNWLAVTAACLAVQRSKFESVGGFDESFVVAGNDVDLCLRLTAAGHRSLCVTDALLVHDESRSRGAYVDPGDFVTSERSYGEFRTIGDPFYNPNLTLERTDCSVRTPAS